MADFCEQSSDCTDLGKPFCDVNGDYDESDHIGRTCIPFPDDATKDFCLDDDGECPAATPVCGADRVCRGCTASAECGDAAAYCDVASGTCMACEPDKFQRCDGADLVVCNAAGTGEDVTTCSTTCDATAIRCDDCTPGAFLGCTDATTASICSSTGVPTDTSCAYACNSTAMRCEQCEPSIETCATGNHVVCDAAGEVSVDETCSLGCSPGLQPICADVDPSNGLATYLDMTATAASLSFSGISTINTATGDVLSNGTQIAVPNFLAGSGNNIRVYVVKDVTITGTVTVSGDKALAFPTATSRLGDLLSIAAIGAAGGPGAVGAGAGEPCEGGPGESSVPGPKTGDGGGSFGTPGGDGGDLTNTTLGLNLQGGARGAWDSTSVNNVLVPLRGGCPGGIGNAVGGAGGGAVQLVSRTRIHFLSGSEINAGGGGGIGVAGTNGAGGGGSGGAILLEAPEITTTGTSALFAIGGGGGCGAEDDSLGGAQADGRDGKDADSTASYQADGGSCTTDGIEARGGHGHPMVQDGHIEGLSITGNNPRGTGAGAGGNGIIRENDLVADGSSSSLVIGAWSDGPLNLR